MCTEKTCSYNELRIYAWKMVHLDGFASAAKSSECHLLVACLSHLLELGNAHSRNVIQRRPHLDRTRRNALIIIQSEASAPPLEASLGRCGGWGVGAFAGTEVCVWCY